MAKAKRVVRVRDRSGALYVVLEPELLDALDAWVERANERAGDGPRWDRTALVKAVFRRALRERGERGMGP